MALAKRLHNRRYYKNIFVPLLYNKSSFYSQYLQPIVTQYLVCNKSEIWP